MMTCEEIISGLVSFHRYLEVRLLTKKAAHFHEQPFYQSFNFF